MTFWSNFFVSLSMVGSRASFFAAAGDRVVRDETMTSYTMETTTDGRPLQLTRPPRSTDGRELPRLTEARSSAAAAAVNNRYRKKRLFFSRRSQTVGQVGRYYVTVHRCRRTGPTFPLARYVRVIVAAAKGCVTEQNIMMTQPPTVLPITTGVTNRPNRCTEIEFEFSDSEKIAKSLDTSGLHSRGMNVRLKAIDGQRVFCKLQETNFLNI